MKERKPINPQARNSDLDRPGSDSPMRTPMTPHKTEARLGREVQIRIGQQLRAMYDEVVSEGVPDHIADLVRRLTEQDDEGPRE
jgi:hypothetical protein